MSNTPSQKASRWIVTQIGSRELYAVPRCLEKRGVLDTLYTDIWCGLGRNMIHRLPGAAGRLSSRYHVDLPSRKVVRFSLSGMYLEASRKFTNQNERSDAFSSLLKIGQWFGQRVAHHLQKRRDFDDSCRIYAYSFGALETLEYCRRCGVSSIVNQIDPGRLDYELIAEEMQYWPGWESVPSMPPEGYYERTYREWDLADLVVVNSEWSRSNIIREGISGDKVLVVPLAYETETREIVSPKPIHNRRLTVLWLGQIILRKGIPYLFEAARQLPHIAFVVAGYVGITPQAIAQAPANVKVLGKVNRTEAIRLFRDSDIFVLPTISDGFALTQLEAMSYGLPVITTPNCGRVVTDGVDGRIIPIRNADALAAAINDLDQRRDLLNEMSGNALRKTQLFSSNMLADRLMSIPM